MPTSPLPLTRESVEAAHRTIKPHIHHTPVLTSRTLNALASAPQPASALVGTRYDGGAPARPRLALFFKCENFQKIGAFKVRGAFHALSRLSEAEVASGVVTHSSGEWAGGCVLGFGSAAVCSRMYIEISSVVLAGGGREM
jgi:threonine dehydratase